MASAKLTLSVDPEVISAAKRYAASHGTSVSELVEGYLTAVTQPAAAEQDTPILNRLRGCLPGADAGAYDDYRSEKYG